jgi:hypothetical protein
MARIISISEIENGMILSEPVFNSSGQTLLSSGVELNQKHIKILKTWNITSLSIHNDDNNNSDNSISPEISKLAKEKVEQRMNWVPRNPIEIDLINTAEKFTAQDLLKKGHD